MPSYNRVANPGLFVSTTTDYDVTLLQDVDVNSDDFRKLMTRLYESVNNISLALNLKDTGYYPLTEYVNGQVFFPDPALSSATSLNPVYRQVFRVVINFGALPNAGAKTVAYVLPLSPANVANYTITRIYAASTNPTTLEFIPIPYVSIGGAADIELTARINNPAAPTQMQATITTASNRTAFTKTYVVLEYLKQ